MNNQRIRFDEYKILTDAELCKLEKEYRQPRAFELIAWANNNTPYTEIVEHIIPDKAGAWKTPLYLICSNHRTSLGMRHVCSKAEEYINTEISKETNVEILSISASIITDEIQLVILLRSYQKEPNFAGFFDFIGDTVKESAEEKAISIRGTLEVPDFMGYSEDEKREHKERYREQKIELEKESDVPPLNRINEYIPKFLPNPLTDKELLYNLETADRQTKLIGSYDKFISVFKKVMRIINGVEYMNYVTVLRGEKPENTFMDFIAQHIEENYISTGELKREDLPAMMKRLYKALFKMYFVQDLIDDPDITDIKITASNCIRCRIHGKAYLSNVTFVDDKDYLRFVESLAIRNHINLNVPNQTFTDQSDERYILRFSIIAPYVTSDNVPVLHIRKIDRNKLLGSDLLRLGMMDEKVMAYLKDCGRTSRGIVFAGPPGSGKTVALNWFLEEAYEQSAEILVIQENDELFCVNRKGVIFEHVVLNPKNDETPVDLEELGQLALVAGANVFIIGETKGPEICSAITLSNSGCRTAITIHSSAANETTDKMADLAMRGYARDIVQAKRMLKSFQIIVYMQDFKVQEITEVLGFDEDKKDMTYRCIYKRSFEEQ